MSLTGGSVVRLVALCGHSIQGWDFELCPICFMYIWGKLSSSLGPYWMIQSEQNNATIMATLESWVQMTHIFRFQGISTQEWSNRFPEVRPYSQWPGLAVIGSTYTIQMGTVFWTEPSTPYEWLLPGKTISWNSNPQSMARDISKHCGFNWDVLCCSLLITSTFL